MTWLLLILVLISFKPNKELDKRLSSILVIKGWDVNHYPSRNSGQSRKLVRESSVPPSSKCLVGLKLANITVCAAFMVVLAGDIQQNPGPVKDACVVCAKGCRKNQKAIQCDLCDQWFHAKCIDMKASEYNTLSDSTKTWQCMKCLFPDFDTPVRCSRRTAKINKEKENDASARMDLNPNLRKRGMKFAHVNIVTLPGHSADVDVLLEETNLICLD